MPPDHTHACALYTNQDEDLPGYAAANRRKPARGKAADSAADVEAGAVDDDQEGEGEEEEEEEGGLPDWGDEAELVGEDEEEEDWAAGGGERVVVSATVEDILKRPRWVDRGHVCVGGGHPGEASGGWGGDGEGLGRGRSGGRLAGIEGCRGRGFGLACWETRGAGNTGAGRGCICKGGDCEASADASQSQGQQWDSGQARPVGDGLEGWLATSRQPAPAIPLAASPLQPDNLSPADTAFPTIFAIPQAPHRRRPLVPDPPGSTC